MDDAKRQAMKTSMIDEIQNMTDDDRLEAEFNSFFGDSADDVLEIMLNTN